MGWTDFRHTPSVAQDVERQGRSEGAEQELVSKFSLSDTKIIICKCDFIITCLHYILVKFVKCGEGQL